MHEWALAESVITTALGAIEKEGMSRITRIVVRIGELQQIKKEIFRDALDTVRAPKDARIAQARIELEVEPARLGCRACQHRFSLDEAAGDLDEDAWEAVHFIPELAHSFLSCPRCQSPDFEFVEGRGVWLETVEGE